MPYPDLTSITFSRRTKELLDSYKYNGESWDKFFQRLIDEAVKADYLEELLTTGQLIPNPASNKKEDNTTNNPPENNNNQTT